jgi:CubicO group peptidase (beta-lactamase class C family)
MLSPIERQVEPDQVRSALQAIADEKSKTYNCSVSIAFKNVDYAIAAAAGIADFSSGRKVTTDDTFAWGSGTKPLTGASILKLISDGHFNLETPVHTVIDPLFKQRSQHDPSWPYETMGEIWGEDNVTGITVGMLLNMTSGIPDFDTAKGHGGNDSLRLQLYQNPRTEFGPFDLMNFSWVAHSYEPCYDVGPHWHKCYSSTNFMLLGLILANGTDWNHFNQSTFLPAELKQKLQFAVTGAPLNYSAVHGYDRTSYNMPKNEKNDEDVSDVAGVFAGWTASDLVGTPTEVASLAWNIYGPTPTILPKQYADMMAKTALERDYGLATFNLERDTGHSGDYGKAYGHLGATYGFQSQIVYFPKLNFVLTVATNIETDSQTQPKDALCFSYNAIAGLMLNQTIKCKFSDSGYYGSGCKCDEIPVPPS